MQCNLAVLFNMHRMHYRWLWVFIAGVGLMACKSGANHASKDTDKVSYNTRKTYNQYYYDGAKAKILGNYDEAESLFEKALKTIPDDHEAMYQLANVQFKNKKNDLALHWAELSVKHNPGYNHWYYGQLAQLYSTTGQYDKSAALFAKMVEKDPARKSNYHEAGNQYINARKPREAIKYFEKSLQKFGPEEEICRKLENIYYSLNQPDEAIRVMRKLADTYPGDLRILGLLAESLSKQNRHGEAKGIYQKILAIDPSNGFACFGMADVLRREGDNDASFSYLSKGFSDPKVNLQHKLKVISSYYFLITKDEKSKDQAFELSRKLMEAHPEDATVYQVQSDMLLTLEQYAEARTYLKKSLALDGKDYRLWQKLFGIDVKLANNRFLFEDSKAALELFATQPGLFIIHSQSALRIDETDKAIETAMQGLDIAFKQDEKLQLYLTLADAWSDKGDYERSDLYFDKALESDQESALALNNYAYSLFKRNSRLDKAEEMAIKAVRMEPENGSYADTYGCILLARGQLDEAEVWILKALRLEGENAEVLEHLGDVYYKQGKTEQAASAWAKALQKDPANKSVQSKLSNLKMVK